MSYDANGNWIDDSTGMQAPDPNLNAGTGGTSDPNANPFDINTADFSQFGYDPGGGGGQILDGSPSSDGTSLLDSLKSLGGLGGVLQTGLGYLSPLLSGILSGPGGKGWGSTIPGMLALAYASRQPGVDTSRLTSVYDLLSGNMNPVIQAATDPIQRNFAAGYGDLLQSQAKRGIRGSSFGDTAIGDFLATGSRSLGDAAANAAQGSLSLQGSLAGNIAQLQQKSQELKNNLYGRAFDTLGRGLNPSGYGMLSSTPTA